MSTVQVQQVTSTPGNPKDLPTREDVERAHQLIAGAVHRTPVMHSRYINSLVGAEIYFKCEHLQAGGAFKYRGASHVMRLLTDAEKSAESLPTLPEITPKRWHFRPSGLESKPRLSCPKAPTHSKNEQPKDTEPS